MSELTRVLSAFESGDPNASQQLLPLVYEELRKLADHKLEAEKPGQTLQATALVHEAYLRLVGASPERHWDGRGHFFGAAAEAMRRILIENARRKRGPKCGGAVRRHDLDMDQLAASDHEIDLLALNDALTRLEQESPARAELVKLRFFAGLTIPEAADVLGVSRATADRYWAFARTWLYAELGDAAEHLTGKKKTGVNEAFSDESSH